MCLVMVPGHTVVDGYLKAGELANVAVITVLDGVEPYCYFQKIELRAFL